MTPDWLNSNLSIFPQLVVNALITGSIYALASSGLALTYGVSRVLNFAHGHLLMLGAYLFFGFFSLLSFPLLLAICASGVSLAVIGAATYLVFIRAFVTVNPLLPFVATLSLSAILESLVSLCFGVNVLALPSGDFSSSWSLLNVYITPLQVIIISSSTITLLSLALAVHKSRWGRVLRAMAANPAGANSLGINSQNVLVSSYVLGVLLAGIAGVLIAFETNLQPTMGSSYTIKAFAAMILGGLGNIWGTVLGAYLLGFIENFAIGLDFGAFSIPSGYRDGFSYLLILIMLLLRPQGLLGSKARNV